MNYSKLVHEYLDGELEESSQDSLFAEMAHSPELRSEFNQQVKLHLITQGDLATISAPIESTNMIFSSLGFSIPAGLSKPRRGIGAGPIGTAVVGLFRKYMPTVMTAVLASAVTALIFIYFHQDFSNGNQSLTHVVKTQVPVVSSTEVPAVQPQKQSNVGQPITQKELSGMLNKAVNNYLSKVHNQNAASDNNDNTDGLLTQQEVSTPVQIVNSVNLLNADVPVRSSANPSKMNLATSGFRPGYLNSFGQQNYYQPEISYPGNSKLEISLRSFASGSFPNVNIPAGGKPWFSNIGIGALYNLAGGHYLGMEAGQEQFGQQFVNKNGIVNQNWSQNPMLFWIGITYKFQLNELIIPEVLYPYAQVFGGGTSIGPLFRGQLGLIYKPDQRVSFSLGIEGAKLYYNVQNILYTTNKLGITYGLSLHY